MSSILTGSTMKKSTNPTLRQHLLSLLGSEHVGNARGSCDETVRNSYTISSEGGRSLALHRPAQHGKRRLDFGLLVLAVHTVPHDVGLH